jgi:hypothetical protein
MWRKKSSFNNISEKNKSFPFRILQIFKVFLKDSSTEQNVSMR